MIIGNPSIADVAGDVGKRRLATVVAAYNNCGLTFELQRDFVKQPEIRDAKFLYSCSLRGILAVVTKLILMERSQEVPKSIHIVSAPRPYFSSR